MNVDVKSLLKTIPQDNHLEHFGIKGMQWGVRRTPEQLSSGKSQKKETMSDRRKARADERKRMIETQESKRKEALKAKNQTDTKRNPNDYKNMSDDELRALVARYNLEAQYKKFNPQKASTAKQVASVIGTTASTIKTASDIVGGLDKVSKNITPQQAKNAAAVLSILSKLEPKKK